MFQFIDHDLNAGDFAAGATVFEPGIRLPPNPRVNFLLVHGSALDRWKLIPYQLGFVTAPLWDHRSGLQQAVIILAFLGSTYLWTRLARPWVESRIGIFRPRAVRVRSSKELVRRQRLRKVALYAALTGVYFGVGLLLCFNQDQDHNASGWMERATSVWSCMAIVDCVNRAADMTNLRSRRAWNIIAGIVLAGGFGFSGATANSYAMLLVLLGSVNIVLALLDLGLLLHFAATPLQAGSEETHA